VSTHDEDMAKLDAVKERYDEIGSVALTRRRDYHDEAVALYLYRCKVCSATVTDEDWPDARTDHDEYHRRRGDTQ
jgi:hypothetical protein